MRALAKALLLALSMVALSLAASAGAQEGDQAVVVDVELVATGLDSPVALADPDDGSGRLFIADQAGTIHVLGSDGELLDEPLLDISEQLAPWRKEGLDERGLLGFALHPEFAENGWLYLHYSGQLRDEAPADWDHTRYVTEFSISADDPDRVNPDSERVLLAQEWPTHKHNGGGLAFGPDGYLYIGFGDGGGIHGIGDRPDYNQVDELEEGERWWPVWHRWNQLAQDLTTLYGKVLRIDVEGGFPDYAIPEDNPLVGEHGRDEIYAWGFRQPYRISFDPEGEYGMFVSATSEYFWESVAHVAEPGNYGWPIKEGTVCYDPEQQERHECPDEGPRGEELRDAIIEYANLSLGEEGVGSANVGGFLYRGSELPELRGSFVFADWSEGFDPPAGQVFAATPGGGNGPWPFERILQVDAFILSVGRDSDGEIYLLTNRAIGLGEDTGEVYRLVQGGGAGSEGDGSEGNGSEGNGSQGNGSEGEGADPTEGPEPAQDEQAAVGTFTPEQVERGQEAYREHCASCHGENLEGGGHFPPLMGDRFMRRWEGRTAWELFEYTHGNMPLGNPGSLEEQTYADILALQLAENGFLAGEEELTPDEEDLGQLLIEPQGAAAD